MQTIVIFANFQFCLSDACGFWICCGTAEEIRVLMFIGQLPRRNARHLFESNVDLLLVNV